MKMERLRLPAWLCALVIGVTSSTFSVYVNAATVIEEVVVTAQRTEESLQDVPIAVTALTGEMLEDKGIINPSDLQMTAPNVSFTSTNFGGSSFSIRGIGRLVISANADSGVSTHINEIPLVTNLNAVEFYDVERVEVLRGPQGTLYGRNATGGAINLVTKMPDFEDVSGFIDAEAGDYDHTRIKGAINIPFSETMGIRIAGFKLDRDGYIDNVAADSVSVLDGSTLPNIDDDIDGRDILSYRATWAWDFSDKGKVWVQYSYFDEDDDRARITNQICQRTTLPALGCEPDGVGFDAPHLGSTTGGLFFALNGLGTLPLGADGRDGVNGISYDHPQPAGLGIRDMFTDFEPVFEYEEDIYSFGAEYAFETMTVSVIGAYQETDYLQQMDYNMDVGPLLGPSPAEFGLNGLWPVSAPAGRSGGDVTGANGCRYNDGTSGIFGGCIVDGTGPRLFALDQASSETEYWTVEARVASNFDGWFNFQLGVTAYENERIGGDYYVNANSLDSIGLVGVGLLGFPPLYPTMFNVPGAVSDPSTNEGEAIFAEGYFDLSDRLKLTVGLRYNKDEKFVNNANAFLSSVRQDGLAALFSAVAAPFTDPNAVANVTSGLVTDPLIGAAWSRLTNFLSGGLAGPTAGDEAVLLFNGVSQAEIDAANATLAYSPERVAAAAQVGLITGFNEVRNLNGNPDTEEWTSVTGRIGLDFQLNENVMLFGFLSRGYKPGGFNPPIAPEFQDDTAFAFEEEEVDAIEVGIKSTLADGQLILNGSAFWYDYEGLQTTRIRNNSSINENIDSEIMGVEIEWIYQPDAVPGLAIDGSFSWLDTELQDVQSVDVINKSAGDPNWVNLKNIDPGALTGTNYIAFAPDITATVIADAYANNGALSDVNGTAVPGTVYTGGSFDGIPAYFSRNFLEANGVATSSGLPSNLDGNNLPNSPEYTFRLGVQYTWNIDAIAGALTARWDYYWQDDSFGREFNTVGDEIDSWDQHNISFIYESDDGHWQGRLWARNLEDEDNVTGHYLTSDTSGYFRNWFLTEPRVYGLTVRYSFGN